MSSPPRLIRFTERKRQKKFEHAADLGIQTSYNKDSAQFFADALRNHISDPNVQQIVGTFRGNPVIHCFEETSGIDIMTEPDGSLISVWKLNEKQQKNLAERGSL